MALKVLSNITVPTPRDDDAANNISYGTDAATRGYVDSNSGSGSVNGIEMRVAAIESSYVTSLSQSSTTIKGAITVGSGLLVSSAVTAGGIVITPPSISLKKATAGTASTGTLGGVIVGTGLSVDVDGVISISQFYQSKINNAGNPYTFVGSDCTDNMYTSTSYRPTTESNVDNLLPLSSYTYCSPDAEALFQITDADAELCAYYMTEEVFCDHFVSQKAYAVGDVIAAFGWLIRCSTAQTSPYIVAGRWERVPPLVDGRGRLNVQSNKQRLKTVPASANVTLTDSFDGWLLTVASNVSSCSVTMPTLSNYTASGYANFNEEVLTYEMLVRCASGTGTVGLTFSNVEFLDGNQPTNLERGYTHFIVLRNFPTGSTTRKWVGNIQGKVSNS